MINKEQNKPFNILDDVCQITTIPVASMNRLFDKINYCIANAVYEGYLRKDNTTELNIGVGTLLIQLVNNTITYKFIPNAKLEKNIVDSIVNKRTPLDIQLEETFAARILNTYKDMI